MQQAYWELVFALRDQQNQLENLNLSRENLRNVEAKSQSAPKRLERAGADRTGQSRISPTGRGAKRLNRREQSQATNS